MSEIVKLKFVMDESEKLEPGTNPADGNIELDLAGKKINAKVVEQTVAEDGRSVELALELDDGALLDFYSSAWPLSVEKRNDG